MKHHSLRRFFLGGLIALVLALYFVLGVIVSMGIVRLLQLESQQIVLCDQPVGFMQLGDRGDLWAYYTDDQGKKHEPWMIATDVLVWKSEVTTEPYLGLQLTVQVFSKAELDQVKSELRQGHIVEFLWYGRGQNDGLIAKWGYYWRKIKRWASAH